MKKKVKVFVALLMVMTLTLGITITAFAVTPQYKPLSEYGYTGVPDIEVELSDDIKQAIDKSVSDFITKCKLDKPTITNATFWKFKMQNNEYASLTVVWDKVEGATSYKVEINNNDGTSNTYETTYNILSVNSYKDDFVKSITNESTIRIKAYGDNDTFSLWSDKKNPYVLN